MSEPPSAEPVVRIRRVLPATPEDIFHAWTDAENLKVWMCPETTTVASVDLDVRVGGRFRIVMRTAEGRDLVHTGEYREIRPPTRLVFTWQSTMTRSATTLVTVALQAHGDATELMLTHAQLPDAPSRGAHEQGWQSIVTKLQAYVHYGG